MADRRARNGEPAVRREGEPDAVELLADPDRPRAWTLLIGSTPQSYVDLDDPSYLDFEYVRRLGHLIDLAAPAGQPLRVLHLGGGALTLARYVAATRPGSGQLAVDSDADVVSLVRERLPLHQPSRRAGGQAGRIRIRIGDARAILEQLPAGSFDVVVADLFAGARTPAHLTTAEFAAAARRALRPDGIFAVNIGDGPPLAHTRARTAAALTVFRSACLIADAAVLRGRRFGNLVLAASDRDLPPPDLARRVAADPFPGRVVAGPDLERFTSGARPITDDRAQLSPVPPPGVFAPS
ncbi:MAG TPA: fused MFS/spermidine synthase [Streptosporangiaceae bacterium]|jgi:spermidine synthase|nr:fused MFS/spermidine synthase [Streptosporangiaceae bacterium]